MATNLRWGRLRHTRNLVPQVVLYRPNGRECVIEIRTKRELVQLISDTARVLAEIEHAEELNRACEAARAEAKALFAPEPQDGAANP